MSENKPENAGKPGSPSSPSATPTPSTSSTPSGATPGASKPDVLPPEPAVTLPLSHEDSIQSPIKDVVTPSAASPAAEEAAARSSTDDPDSASTVTPTDAQTARQRDAAEARSSAAASTAQQEAEVHERAARKAGQAYKTPATRPSTLGSSEPLAGELSAPADEAALTANEEKTEEAAASARRAGSPPPGFGAAPDFTATNPPPPNALPPSPPRYLKQSDSAWTVFGRIIAARARQLFDRAGQRITQRTLRIGVSARIFHPEPGAKGLRGKTLQYLEESIAHWVMSRDVLVFMIPTVGHQGMLHPSNIRLRDYAKHLDGLLLQGGADVSPQSYAEQATSHEWPGDRVRDMYELELLHEFIESGKPVLGVCRGCQLINVAFGGTLVSGHRHRCADRRRARQRAIRSASARHSFPGWLDARQHVPGPARSDRQLDPPSGGQDARPRSEYRGGVGSDGIIEAVRYRRAPFVMGVQWHPEFHRAGGPELLDCTPLLDTFLRVARETRF